MSEQAKGVIYAVTAFLSWGMLPLYWKLLQHYPALEVTAHRILWSSVFLLLLLGVRGKLPTRSELRSRKMLLLIFLPGILISVNWLIYIWAVNQQRILECSLGYYCMPLVNVVLGMLIFGETLTERQKYAVACALLGILTFGFSFKVLPWIPLGLALTFGFYGVIRKSSSLSPMVGTAAESTVMAPLALIAILVGGKTVVPYESLQWGTVLLLSGCGIVTCLPLIWFSAAARRIKLATLGFLQYLGPTTNLLLAVFVYGEPFTRIHAVTFGLIWAGIVLYLTESVRGHLRNRSLAGCAVPVVSADRNKL